jgi:hypothetical protein
MDVEMFKILLWNCFTVHEIKQYEYELKPIAVICIVSK